MVVSLVDSDSASQVALYMQLVSNPKVNLSEPLSPVCLQPG